jgi:hypothetical protein
VPTVRRKRRHGMARKRKTVRRVSARSVPRVRGKRNPGRGDILIGTVHEIRYHHVSEGQRYHTFGPGVKMYGRPDGSLYIRHPRLRSWDMEDNL